MTFLEFIWESAKISSIALGYGFLVSMPIWGVFGIYYLATKRIKLIVVGLIALVTTTVSAITLLSGELARHHNSIKELNQLVQENNQEKI